MRKSFNKLNNEPFPFANVAIQGSAQGAVANENGEYEIVNLNPGHYNLEASFVGFRKLVVYEVQVTNARPVYADFAMEEEARQLEDVVVEASNSFVKPEESPLSFRTIGTTEIKRTPGGNRDVSKVVRSLPGVASYNCFIVELQ